MAQDSPEEGEKLPPLPKIPRHMLHEDQQDEVAMVPDSDDDTDEGLGSSSQTNPEEEEAGRHPQPSQAMDDGRNDVDVELFVDDDPIPLRASG